MIGYLSGRIVKLAEDHVIIETHGVGYLVQCDQRTIAELTNAHSVELWIETQVREDAITLFGFQDEAAKAWFKRLLNIQGVGARSALSLLSALTPEQIATAVMAQDRTPLTKASGVGPKLAGRIVAELKDRLPDLTGMATAVSRHPAGPSASPSVPPGVADDAIAALVQLGYGRSEVFAVVTRLAADDSVSLDELIKRGLKELSA